MAGKRKTPEENRMRIFAVRAAAIVIVVIALLLIGRAWLKSAFSCVRMFESMEYVDEDERERLVPWITPAPETAGLTDQSYDRVFPDLVEPTVSPSETQDPADQM